MFRKNDQHLQMPLFSSIDSLPEKQQNRLEESWAGTFYHEFFCRIDEEPMSVLYSDEASRPNIPINVLVGLDALKAGFGWSDEEMYDHFCFDVQVRYAVGASDLKGHPLCPHCGYRPVEEPTGKSAQAVLDEREEMLGQLHADWTNALLTNLRQEATQANVALMTPDQQKLIKDFLDAGALPDKVGYDFLQTVKEALTGLERVAVPPEDIRMALTQGGMPCTVQELLTRFRNLVDEQVKGTDSNKVRTVVEW